MSKVFLDFRRVLEKGRDCPAEGILEEPMTRKMSRIRKDFILSHLRSNLQTIQSLISDIEDNQASDDETDEYLKKVEIDLRTIRRLWKNN